METLPRWATKKEAASYARCAIITIDRYLASGKLTKYGHVRKVLIDLNEVDALILSKEAN